jgi:hypothetical protein
MFPFFDLLCFLQLLFVIHQRLHNLQRGNVHETGCNPNKPKAGEYRSYYIWPQCYICYKWNKRRGYKDKRTEILQLSQTNKKSSLCSLHLNFTSGTTFSALWNSWFLVTFCRLCNDLQLMQKYCSQIRQKSVAEPPMFL